MKKVAMLLARGRRRDEDGGVLLARLGIQCYEDDGAVEWWQSERRGRAAAARAARSSGGSLSGEAERRGRAAATMETSRRMATHNHSPELESKRARMSSRESVEVKSDLVLDLPARLLK